MKTDASATTLSATKLAPILKRYAPASAPEAPTDPIATLVQSFLLWEASTSQAVSAIERIRKECVDFNELRVDLPEEIIAIIGLRYPFVDERSNRMRRSLNDLYKREHKVSLDHVSAMGKREQRTYVENLDGMLPFVAARILLFHFGHAVIPVDDQLADIFRDSKFVAKETPTADLAHALTKQHNTIEDALKVHHALVGFADSVWEKDPKAMQKLKQARLAAQQSADRAARREAEKAAEAAAKAAEAAAKLEAERAEAAKVAAKAAARAEAKAARQVAQQAAQAAAQQVALAAAKIAARDAKALKTIADAKAAAKNAGKPPVKAETKSAAKPGTKVLEKHANTVAKKSGHGALPKPTAKPAAKPTTKPSAKTSTGSNANKSHASSPKARAVAKSGTRAAGKPAGKTAAKLVAKPATKGTSKSVKKGSKK